MTAVVQHKANDTDPVELTSAARQRIISYLQDNKQVGLRLSLKRTGCSGLSYALDYVDSPSEDDIVFSIDSDRYIYIDRKSFPYLKGLKIDYARQGINQKFVFENPNQTGQCGCGESFTVEDSKN